MAAGIFRPNEFIRAGDLAVVRHDSPEHQGLLLPFASSRLEVITARLPLALPDLLEATTRITHRLRPKLFSWLCKYRWKFQAKSGVHPGCTRGIAVPR